MSKSHNEIMLDLTDAFGECQLNATLKLLNGGYSTSINYLVVINNTKYVYRELNPKSSYQNRKKECLATKFMSDKLIGAQCFYMNEEYTFIIIEYLDGRDANHNDIIQSNDLFFNAIRKLHTLNTHHQYPKVKTLLLRINAYLSNIPIENNIITLSQLNTAKKLYNSTLEKKHLCFVHGDLNHNNIRITKNDNLLIDWADFGLGCPLEDLSSLGRGLLRTEQQHLLTQYYQRSPSEKELNTFGVYCHIHWLLLASWALEQLSIKQISIATLLEQPKTQENISAHQFLRDCLNSKIDLSNNNCLAKFVKLCLNTFNQSLDIKLK